MTKLKNGHLQREQPRADRVKKLPAELLKGLHNAPEARERLELELELEPDPRQLQLELGGGR